MSIKYIVTKPHRSEYPEPIQLKKGDALVIGERHEGSEGWEDWFLCTSPGQAGGWVPKQVIEQSTDGTGHALEDYSAQELDVDTNEILVGFRTLNGWAWCQRLASPEAGWVPLENLHAANV